MTIVGLERGIIEMELFVSWILISGIVFFVGAFVGDCRSDCWMLAKRLNADLESRNRLEASLRAELKEQTTKAIWNQKELARQKVEYETALTGLNAQLIEQKALVDNIRSTAFHINNRPMTR